MPRYTEALGTVRELADEPRVIEGTAVPYGVVSLDTEFGREAFAPGAFRDSVAHWMGRQDGARMAFRPAHGERPVGAVIHMEDRPDGVFFRAKIRNGPAGDEYLAAVAEGLNGVSIEPAANDLNKGRRTADGTLIHRAARLLAIAGSVSPAYDGARIATRDMEDAMSDQPAVEPTPTPAAQPAEAVTAPRDAETARRDAEKAEMDALAPRRGGIVITRDALIYGREAASLPNGRPASFLSDGWHAKEGDSDARDRQYRYEQATNDLMRQMERDALTAARAGDVLIAEIPGAYPNDYLPGLLLPRIMKGRPMGGFFGRVPISDALPKIYPTVTTSTTVAVEGGELTNPAASDFATTAVTATPLLYGAETVVSRQVLDGSSPAAEAMIMQDMLEAYAQASETVIKTSVEAGAAAAGTAITAATPYAGIVGNVVEYAGDFFQPAEGQFIPPALFAVAAAQLDGANRPLLANVNPQNSTGGMAADNLGFDVLGARAQLSYASTVNVVVTARRNDYVIFESPIARFSYDAVTGPTGVRIGIWAYLVVGKRRGGNKVTAA